MSEKVIKTLAPILCPHCGQEAMVSLSSVTPRVDWALKPETLKNSKNKIIEKLEKFKFRDENEKKEILAWLSDDNTAFGPEEADAVFDQVIRDYVNETPKDAPKEAKTE